MRPRAQPHGGNAGGTETATCDTLGQAPPSAVTRESPAGRREQPLSPGDPRARSVPGRGLGHRGATRQGRGRAGRSDSAGRQASPTR